MRTLARNKLIVVGEFSIIYAVDILASFFHFYIVLINS